jgi:hypothetical protein
MARKSNYLISGLAVVALMICALPVAEGLGAATKQPPAVHVNRAAKGDRLVEPRTIARKTPADMQREPLSSQEPVFKRIMDGCEPMFSPVTVPSMAHLAGRCFG